MGCWFSRVDDVDALVAQRFPKDIYRLILAYAVKLQNLVTLDSPACAIGLVDENTIVVARHAWMDYSSRSYTIEKLDLATGERLWSKKAHDVLVFKLIVLDNGQIVGSIANGLAVWNREGTHVSQIDLHGACRDICAMQGSKVAVKLWENRIAASDSFNPELHIVCPLGGSQAMATFGESVITGHNNGNVVVWENGECVQDFPVCDSAITGLCASERLVVAGACSGLVFACDLQGSVLRVFEGHDTRVSHLVCWGKKIAAASHTRTVRVWDMDSGGCQTLTNFGFPVTDLVVNKQKLIVGSQRCIRVWE